MTNEQAPKNKSKCQCNRLLFFLLLALCSLFPAFAQTQPAEVFVLNANGEPVFSFQADVADPAMRQVPRDITSQRQRDDTGAFLRALAGYINERSSSEYDKVKKAHDWIALNIKYDTASYFSGRYSPQDAYAVIRRGSGVCAGYADAFKALCDVLEIECDIVAGFARGLGRNLFQAENPTSTNHDWNIVTIDGKKYIIDSTWNAGYVNGRTFKAQYRTDYLFIDPAVFIYDHFPYYSRNQLLDEPVSAQVFVNLPFLKPLFFEAFETWPDIAKVTEISAGENVSFEFTPKPGYTMGYDWFRANGTRINSFTIYPGRNGDVYRVSTPSSLRAGNYWLQIYVKRTGQSSYADCGQFGFTVK